VRANRFHLAVLLLSSLAPAAYAQRAPFSIPDPDPEVERKSFIITDGFEVNLFAADPILAKPLQINFDPAGRLWVASSEVYPQILPGQVANDKVLILEDRDGDGRADRTSVFADGLLIPTGIAPGDGGAYVANSTELLHLKDTDGDGKADHRRVVLSGFGTEDTHHILHTLRWGPDGRLYFNQSTYTHSHIETPYGVRRLGGGGIWQFRPETMRLEVFTRGLINPWGHHFDRWGQQFATDGAGSEGINYMVPGASYAWTPGAARILPGLNPGSPKYCGLEVLGGRHLPESWRGNLLTNDFRANRVCRFVLGDDGSAFAAREQAELIKTPHVAFRPIDVKMGPDGAIYIADWYNPIIQHGEVDFRDPRRDHTRGRIWRVTAKGRPLVERPKLVGATVEALLEALKAPEDWTRHQAKRVLKERGAGAVAPTLAAWVQGLGEKGPDAEHHRLEALWTYQSLDLVEPGLLSRLLRSADPRVRAAAVRVAGDWHDRLSDPLALLADRVTDDHPRVRLEAVRALARVPSPRSADLALRALGRPTDRFLDYASWLSARELGPQWLPAVRAGTLDFGDAGRLLFALEALGTPEVVGPLLEALRAGKIPQGQEERALKLIAAVGGPKELGSVLDLALADATPAPRRAALLDALTATTRLRKTRPAGDLDRLGPLLDADDALRGAALRAIGAWKVESLREKVLRISEDGGQGPRLTESTFPALIEALAGLGGAPSRERLEDLARHAVPHERRTAAIVALAALDPKAAASSAVGRLASRDESSRPAAAEVERLVAGLLQRRDGPAALADALKGPGPNALPADAAKVALRTVRASGRPEPALVDALSRAGGLTGGPVEPSTAELERLVADVRRAGDPARGEAIFRRAYLACLKCHAIAGAGGQVGPGLESIGASAPVDYLFASLFQPDKAIKEGYHSTVVATTDGRIVSGIKVRQTDRELVLRDAEGQEVAIAADAIEGQKPGGSLMPAGLADSLTRDELIDLVRFLSELGKVGPYAVGQARVIRRWQALEPTPPAQEALRRLGLGAAAGARAEWRWSPAYSTVAGTLPTEALPAFRTTDGAPRIAVVRGQVDVTTAGKVRLRLNSPEGLEVWVDDARAEPRERIDLDLGSGLHTLTFAIDLDRRREGLRCELEDVPGSPARAQVVGGR
jgi:putative heme-binding domain-containing protein